MDEFILELRELDESQERVETVSDAILNASKVSSNPDVAVSNMIDAWIQALRSSDFQSERIAYLYVANHVLQKNIIENDVPIYLDASITLKSNIEKSPSENVDAESTDEIKEHIGDHTPTYIISCFSKYLKEAVSLVSNSPIDRQAVLRLLQLWYEKDIFSTDQIREMWECTGEDLPSFLQDENKIGKNTISQLTTTAITTSSVRNSVSSDVSLIDIATLEQEIEMQENEDPTSTLHHLRGHSVNPVLDALKKIDRHKAVIEFLTASIQEKYQFVYEKAADLYPTPESLVEESAMSVSGMRKRVEECLKLVKIRQKFLKELFVLEKQAKNAIDTMIAAEEVAAEKMDQKFEQCDTIDIGLAVLKEHREKYPQEWESEASACLERRLQREELQRQREEEIAKKNQEAIAESAAHAMDLEKDIEGGSSSLQSLSKEIDARETTEKESKSEETNEMVWHPVLKELVPLQSLNVEWESWRDH